MTSPYERNREIEYAYAVYMQARINRATTGPDRLKCMELLDEALGEIANRFDDELIALLEDSNDQAD